MVILWKITWPNLNFDFSILFIFFILFKFMNNNDNKSINKNLSLMDIENMLKKGILPPQIENIKDCPSNNINIFPIIEDFNSLNNKPWLKK